MSPIHGDDSIFDLIANSSDPQQPIVVEESLIDSDDFQDTLVDSDHESDRVTMESDSPWHGDFQDTLIDSDDFQDTLLDSPAVGGLNGHYWFPHQAEPQPDLTADSLCELWEQPMCEEEPLLVFLIPSVRPRITRLFLTGHCQCHWLPTSPWNCETCWKGHGIIFC